MPRVQAKNELTEARNHQTLQLETSCGRAIPKSHSCSPFGAWFVPDVADTPTCLGGRNRIEDMTERQPQDLQRNLELSKLVAIDSMEISALPVSV